MLLTDLTTPTVLPLLLSTGQKNIYFNLRAILGWLSVAMLHALIILLIVLLGADGLEADRGTGVTWGLQQNGVLMFSIVVITVHLQLTVTIDQWTWLHHVSIWGSICEYPPPPLGCTLLPCALHARKWHIALRHATC